MVDKSPGTIDANQQSGFESAVDVPVTVKKSKRADPRPLSQVLLSGIAGGIAGCVAKTGVAPFDRVKILLQTGEPDFIKYSGSIKGPFLATADIFRRSGMRGLMQGHSATLLRIFPYAGIKFMVYDSFHLLLMPRRELETSVRLATAGALSGVTSVFFTYPLDLMRVRLAYETKRAPDHKVSLRETARIIYHERAPLAADGTRSSLDRFPLAKFYRGYLVSIMGVIPYAGVSFSLWGRLQHAVRQTNMLSPQSKRRWRTPIDLACGAIAGAMSQTASYPFEVIRRRMQIGGLSRPGELIGFGETVKHVYRTFGVRGFFVGLGIGYFKIVPMSALSFATWKACKRLFNLPD